MKPAFALSLISPLWDFYLLYHFPACQKFSISAAFALCHPVHLFQKLQFSSRFYGYAMVKVHQKHTVGVIFKTDNMPEVDQVFFVGSEKALWQEPGFIIIYCTRGRDKSVVSCVKPDTACLFFAKQDFLCRDQVVSAPGFYDHFCA